MQQPGLAAGLELAPKVGDEDVDRVGLLERVIAPDVLEQPLAGDDELLVAGQILEQLELAVREVDLPIRALHLAGVGVELEIADDDRSAAARWAAPEERPDPGEELG